MDGFILLRSAAIYVRMHAATLCGVEGRTVRRRTNFGVESGDREHEPTSAGGVRRQTVGPRRAGGEGARPGADGFPPVPHLIASRNTVARVLSGP